MKNFHLSSEHLSLYNQIVEKNIYNLSNGNENSYVDPDKYIVELFNVNKEQIRFSSDGICGIKYLKKYYKDHDLFNAYSIIRKKIIMWPKHIHSIN